MVTPATSSLGPLLNKIEQLREPEQSSFYRMIRSRTMVLEFIFASIFDTLMHSGAAMLKAPGAVTKLIVNKIPTARLDSMRHRLEGYDDMRTVVNHARKAALYAAEILIIPAGILNPDLVTPFHNRFGLYKAELAIRDTGEDWRRIRQALASKETGIATLLAGTVAAITYSVYDGYVVGSAMNSAITIANEKAVEVANSWTLLCSLAIVVSAVSYCLGRQNDPMTRRIIQNYDGPPPQPKPKLADAPGVAKSNETTLVLKKREIPQAQAAAGGQQPEAVPTLQPVKKPGGTDSLTKDWELVKKE